MMGLTAIGALALLASSVLTWIKGPISGGANPSFSFAWMAAGIGGLAGLAWVRRSPRCLVLTGLAGFCLCSFSVLYLSLVDPALWVLVDENTQAANIITFSLHYTPGNFGIDPTFQTSLPAEALPERIKAALYFTDWGWELCLAGSLLLLVACCALQGRQIVGWIVLPAALILSSQGILLTNGLVGEYLRVKAERDMALGQFARAISRYERAQQWNQQLAKSDRVHSRLGEAYFHIGRTSHPNARFYWGDRYAQTRDFKTAMAEYRAALHESSPLLVEVTEKRLAWTMIDRGMALFRRGGVGSATAEWERALAYDSSQYQAIYFLSKAYFDQARYAQSIAMSQRLLSQSRNPVLNANVHANIGDGFWKLQDYDRARIAYQLSMRLDSQGNFRGYKGLGGT